MHIVHKTTELVRCRDALCMPCRLSRAMRRPGNRRARLLKTLFQCTFVFSLGLSIDTLSDRPSSIWALLALCAAEEQIEQRPACDLHSCTSKLPFQAGERVALRQLATRLAPNLALGQPVVLSSTAQ